LTDPVSVLAAVPDQFSIVCREINSEAGSGSSFSGGILPIQHYLRENQFDYRKENFNHEISYGFSLTVQYPFLKQSVLLDIEYGLGWFKI
jgi:hypothetical protein